MPVLFFPKVCLFAGLMLVLFLFFAAPARAQDNNAGAHCDLLNLLVADSRVKQPEALLKAFTKHGRARLIVSIDPPGASAGYDRLEDRVKAGLDKFLTSLSKGTQKAVIRKFTTIYSFLILATPEQLADILEQQDVRSVEVDGVARPLAAPSAVQ